MTQMNEVREFHTDLDQHSAEYAKDPYAPLADLRSRCPVAHDSAWGGFWMFTSYDAVFDALQQPDLFSSHISAGVPPAEGAQPLIPIHYDPPDVGFYRSFLLGALSPSAVSVLQPKIDSLTSEFIDEFIERGEADVCNELFTPLPARLILQVLGIDDTNWSEWIEWVHGFTHDRTQNPERSAAGIMAMYTAIATEVAKFRDEPNRPGLLGELALASQDGRSLDDGELINMAFLLVLGGMDTTAGLSGNALIRIGENPSLAEEILSDPDIMPRVTEEFLRHDTPTLGLPRILTQDAEFHGKQLRKGDRVMLMFAAANRDPDMFDDPDDIDFYRGKNRHMAFALGVHRCLGSNLARAMFKTMIFQLLDRAKDLKVVSEKVVRYEDCGEVFATRYLPITFTPGERVNTSHTTDDSQ
jgi:cytochrome P450